MKHEMELLTPLRFNGKYTGFLNNCHGYESLLVAEFCEFIEVKKEKLFSPYSG